MTNKLGGVTVVIATLNAARTLDKCLASIAVQKYPSSSLEVLLVDGGSTDATYDIAKKYAQTLNLKVIKAGYPNNMEARRYFGFKQAKHPFVCVLDSDNYLGNRQVLGQLVQPLVTTPSLVGSFSLHYQYVPKFSLLNRYIGLFGQHDPVAFYLDKADRKKITSLTWPDESQVVSQNSKWTVVQFNREDFPTLGSNGFVVRKSLLRLDQLSPESFFHTDILFDLVGQGHNQYAVVDVPIAHESSAGVWRHLSRRFEYMTLHTLNLGTKRRYLVFDPRSVRDRAKLARFVFLTVTLVEPLSQAVVGYLRKPDVAWFLHPVLCWGFLITYTLALVKNWSRNVV